MEVVGQEVAPIALALHVGLHGDHRPTHSHLPDVLYLPDAGIADDSQLLDDGVRSPLDGNSPTSTR